MSERACLQRIQARYGVELDRTLYERINGREDPNFLGMMRYQFGHVDEQLRRISAARGKRFRPLLCLLACESAGGTWRDALDTAAGIELLHNFSLIHDDIEDHDPARHHRPTVWKLWGEPQAINVGDAVFAEAIRAMLASHTDDTACLLLAREFSDVVLRLTEGQYMDMSFETRSDVTPREYLAMIERKTAALIGFALWSGGVIAGARESVNEALRAFGLEMGRAFQIYDDVMGIWGEPEQTGKEAGKDLQNRKKTLPVLIAAERAAPTQRNLLWQFLERKNNDVDEILCVLAETDARQLSLHSAAQHMEAGASTLRAAGLPSGSADELITLARELTGQ